MKIQILHILLLFAFFSSNFLHAQSSNTTETESPSASIESSPTPPAPEQTINQTNQTAQSNQTTDSNRLALDINDWESFSRAIDQGEMKGFFTLAQVEEIIDSFREEFPHIFFPVQIIGQTFEYRDIKMHCLTNREGDDSTIEDEAKKKPMGLVTALHHPREPMSLSMIVFMLFRILVEYHKNEKEYAQLLDQNIICVIPAVNVDGYTYIEEHFKQNNNKFASIRKNRNSNSNVHCPREEQKGVDLNRNYGYCWDCNEQGSSTNPCQEDYRGTAPFSEPETKAIRDLVEKYKESLHVVVNIHAYGNLWIFPFNCYEDDSPYTTQRVKNIYKDFTKNSNLPAHAQVGNAIHTVQYTANGESSDWLLGAYGIIAFSPEIGIHIEGVRDEEIEKFFPGKDYIYPTVEGDYPPIFYMLSRLNSRIDVESTSQKRLKNRNNRKAVYLNFVNRAYADLKGAQIKLNVTLLGIQDDLSPTAQTLPEFSLLENNIDNNGTYNTIPFQTDNINTATVQETNTTSYIITEDVVLKSWTTTQLIAILPFSNYAGVNVQVQITKGNTELFSYNSDFDGLETITTVKEISILGIALIIAAFVFIIIVCATHYYLKGKKAEKRSMYGKNQAPGLEFAQIGEDESGEYGV